MSFSKQDIITSIKNSELFLKIPELKGAKPRLKKDGGPFCYTGGFNMVFQIDHKDKKWALRVWHIPVGEQKDRYRKISEYLSDKKLPYFADFIYDEKSILVNGQLLDTIRMEWLEGKLLKDFLEENLSNPNVIRELAENFLEMCKTLKKHHISHGDLQHGNILVENNQIKLIDYDSICIPEIEGDVELVTGLKGYQHPSRLRAEKASLKADYFSELVIYLSLLAIAENPDFWIKYNIKDSEYLLFTDKDFDDFEHSEIYKDLQNLSFPIKSLTRILVNYLKEKHYTALESFEFFLTSPKINEFSVSKFKILQGDTIELYWDIANEDVITINNKVEDNQRLSISPTQNTKYKIIAENGFGRSEKEIEIVVHPLPKIKVFQSQKSKIEYGTSTELSWEVENVEKVELKYLTYTETIPNKGQKTIFPTEHTDYKLVIIALDEITKEEQEIKVQVFKKVEIVDFSSNLEYVIESIPLKLNWDIRNASEVIIEDNIGRSIDVSNLSYTDFPTHIQMKYVKIIAKDYLGNSFEKKIDIQVDALPKINLSLPKIEVPNLDLSLGDKILKEISFEEAFLEAKKDIKIFNPFKKK